MEKQIEGATALTDVAEKCFTARRGGADLGQDSCCFVLDRLETAVAVRVCWRIRYDELQARSRRRWFSLILHFHILACWSAWSGNL